jgi:hypothetical protein
MDDAVRPTGLRERIRLHVQPVLFAAAAMTPGIILLLAIPGARGRDWMEWLVVLPVAVILCFVVSLVVVVLLGPPASLVLASLGRNTGVAHAVLGASLAIFLFASYVLGMWFLVEPGPFSLSLPEQVKLSGVARALVKALLYAIDLALCGAIAGYVYWFKLNPMPAQARLDLNPSPNGDP